jgi:ABC-2 type transport system permease protein
MRPALDNTLRLGIKELRSLRADPILLVLIAYIFTYAVYAVATGVTFEVRHAAVGIVDEDRSDLSRRIGLAILEPYFKPPVELAADQIDNALDSGDFVFVIEIPPRFEQDALAGRRPSIAIDIDATALAQAGNGAVYLQQIVVAETQSFAARREAGVASPLDLVVRAKFNPNLNSRWFMAVMQLVSNVTILSVILTGASLLREREHGTIEHLIVMPVRPVEIMLGKIWANGLVIVAAAILSLWLVVQWLLAVPIAGSVTLFIVGAVVYQFSVTSLGILLATFSTSMAQFALLALPVVVIMYLLSGGMTPLESMPIWLQDVMQIVPSTHFVAFSQAVLYRAAGIEIVWPQLLVLAVIGIAYFLVSLWRFRKVLMSFQ